MESVLNGILWIVEVCHQLIVKNHTSVSERITLIDNLHYAAIAAIQASYSGTGVGTELATCIHRQGRVLEEVEVDVRTNVISLVARAGLHAEIIGIMHNGLLVEVVQGHVVFHAFGASGHAHVSLPLRGRSVE